MRGLACAVMVVIFASASSRLKGAEAGIHITIEGKWVADAPDGTEVTYEFSKEGGVVWRVEDETFKRVAPGGLKGKYKIRVAKPVWQIDITDFEHPEFSAFEFLGIIAIQDAKSFRMEGEPGRRPRDFGEGAIVFKAVEE